MACINLLATAIAALLMCLCCVNSVNHCPDCGSTSVPYPLSTRPDCGDQSYKVRCEAGVLKFDTLTNTYLIISISQKSQRLVIKPANFLGNACVTADLCTMGIQLNSTGPFNITKSNTVIYLNCSDKIIRSSSLDCGPASLCHKYINGSISGSVCRYAQNCCMDPLDQITDSYSIWVGGGGCQAYRSFVNLNVSLPVSRWPDPGVEIEWANAPVPLCKTQADCNANSTCALAPCGDDRCLCNSGFTWDAISGVCVLDTVSVISNDHHCSKTRIPTIALVCSLVTTLLATITGLMLCRRHQCFKVSQGQLAREREEILAASGGRKAGRIFTAKEIKRATNNFSRDRLLGAGGYGEVYKGILKDGMIVAVKCAKLGSIKGSNQLLNEVRVLCQVNHKGLVQLLGCCIELAQPLLVYEYISNGSLWDHLNGRNHGTLTWRNRLSIARDTAEGLTYLHFSAVPPIYHRDIKSSNILIDEKMNAKVADFGLSRLAHTDLSHVTTCAQGTLGYLDPEYYRNYQLTDKSDVYSFGVLLLELLTSERAIDFNRPADDVNLVVYVKRLMEDGRLVDAIDPTLKEGASSLYIETMKALGFLAMSCLEECRRNRPSMREVTEEIEYIMSIVTAEAQDL